MTNTFAFQSNSSSPKHITQSGNGQSRLALKAELLCFLAKISANLPLV